MMRLRFWRAEPQTDALDPELLSIFEASTRPTLDPARMARGRARVAAGLRPEPATGGWFGRRLAYGLAGGGSVWGALIGTAAAHKAVAAIGLGVLLAGGAAAEVTGIGPAVREAVSPVHSSSEPVEEAVLEATAEATVAGEAAIVALAEVNGAAVTEAPEGVPGSLMANLRWDGRFLLRGVLVYSGDGMIQVQTSLDDVPVEFDLGDALVRLPGPANAGGGPNATESDPTLEDFEGHVLLISGRCETVDGLLTEDCVLTVVTVLGNAGQGGPPDGASQPDSPGKPEGVGPPESQGQGLGQTENPGQGAGQPEEPGQPDDVPRND